MTQKELKIALFVPDEEAKKFILFQQHFEAFSTMLEQGVFSQKSASVTLHFDPLGKIGAIDITKHVWRAGKVTNTPPHVFLEKDMAQ